MADRFGITISALYAIITRVTDFILSLAPNIIRYPTVEEKEETCTFYLDKKGFPGIIGKIFFYICLKYLYYKYYFISLLPLYICYLF